MATTPTEKIWNEHAGRIRTFIRRRIVDSSLVDDLLQEVFVKVQSRIETLKDEDRLQAWLYQITRNIILDHFRRRTPEEELLEGMDVPATAASHIHEELADCVRPMMKRLPAEYRIPLTWSDLEGLPQKEVAQKLGMTLSATKSRIQRGRERLRTIFDECCDFQFDHRGTLLAWEPRKNRCVC